MNGEDVGGLVAQGFKTGAGFRGGFGADFQLLQLHRFDFRSVLFAHNAADIEAELIEPLVEMVEFALKNVDRVP